MLIFGSKPETLPVTIQCDPTSNLPLLEEQGAIMQIILAYLALPYSVTEYGCGKKASLIINQLLSLNIPSYALARGLALEQDMSPAALGEKDHRRRSGALVADNPLYHLVDIEDQRLGAIFRQNSPVARLSGDGYIQAGPYTLSHAPQVQFVTARSHIYTIVTFWDEDNACAVDRVIDPSLHRTDFFAVEEVRDLLNAPEALLFDAPLLARFRLDENRLRPGQAEAVTAWLPEGESLSTLSYEAHASLVRKLTSAEPGSIGDPETWTYANNVKGSEYSQNAPATDEHVHRQYYDTGRGDDFRETRQRFFRAREMRTDDASAIAAELRDITERSNVRRIAAADAVWSVRELEPLADTAMTLVYFNALQNLAQNIQAGGNLLSLLDTPAGLQRMRGVGVRLRRRIDWLGNVSTEPDGRIDARALSPGFVAATLETIRQMNRAGLTVFIDKVGNLHGLLLDELSLRALSRGDRRIRDFTAAAVAHCSHIDTVNDAGRFDGRLGVLAGVETAHVLHDLQRHCDIPLGSDCSGIHTLVTAFVGEEMTFTGGGISMPGSAAVAGRATPEQVHDMRNGDDERFGDCLLRMLQELAQQQREGNIELFNRLGDCPADSLLAACSSPGDFYTPHTYERHIEQGPVLDRADAPSVMVGTIMGIHQEDFVFSGIQAEPAALELNRRMRELTEQEYFADVRITAGIIEGLGESRSVEKVFPALRWTFEGELNHAGATPTPDRRDPGVAAARMARVFLDWFRATLAVEKQADLLPLIGNIRLTPGTNRNVIPGSASMTIAIAGNGVHPRTRIDDFIREDLSQTLEGFAIGTLARRVAGGGEGVRLCRVEPVSYTNTFDEARITIDLRAAEETVCSVFRERIDEILKNIEKEYAVTVRTAVQQHLQPFSLAKTGQALLMERSYGGSHNPKETELLSDLVRGCILQIALTREVLAYGDIAGLNLFSLLEERIPPAWRSSLDRFTSGALHDTCNIAARALQG